MSEENRSLIEQAILKHFDGNEVVAMDTLQNRGLVSDEATWLKDCAGVDLVKALAALDGTNE